MKVSGGPPAIDPAQRLDQAYGAKTPRSAPAAEAAGGLPEPGRLLKGKVVSVEAGGLLTIDTALGSFKATSGSVLEVGREFWFQVVQAGANPLLAEAGKTNAVLNLLRVLLPGMIGADGATLTALFPPAGEGQEVSQDAARLLNFLADNAVDGKPDPGKLLKTLSHLDLSRPVDGAKTGSQPLEILTALRELDSPAAQKLARLLEAHSTVNQQPPPAGAGSDYFLFPVFFAEQAGRGEWLFSFEQESGGEDAALTSAISFYLSMSQLGDIHLSVTARPNALTGVFTLTTEGAADHVRRHLPQLTEALRPLAEKVSITCRTAPFDCLKTLKDDLTTKMGLEERFALVDVKA